ncbi:hypothetical protein CANINC_003251 [Pichia inconspicua]|uniref:Protein BIG1 n=1 Tax=Pichia inconspicua TaxID=52247 RepID=A0A4V4NFH8_9ASCO|nr:hypothetical protein CANINC_003251 [[Candida] inconspicua]
MWSLLLYIVVATASILRTTPAIFVSHKLIPGLRPSLPHSEQLPFTQNEAETLLTRALETCNNEHYIFIKAKGLNVDAFQDFSAWHILRDRMSKASTLLTMPHILDPKGILINFDNILSWEKLENTLLRDCNAHKYEVNYMDVESFPKIQHTDKILIEVTVPHQRIREIDGLIRDLTRKLPTPNVAVLIAGTHSNVVEKSIFEGPVIEIKDLPDDPKLLPIATRDAAMKSKRYIFPDITVFDKSRGYEYERNNIGERRPLSDLKDGEYAKDAEGFVDDSWLEKKFKQPKFGKYGEEEGEFVSVFQNQQFVKDNALVIACMFTFIVGLFFFETLRGFVRMISGKKSISVSDDKKNK